MKRYYHITFKINTGQKNKWLCTPEEFDKILDNIKDCIRGIDSMSEEEYKQKYRENNTFNLDLEAIKNNAKVLDSELHTLRLDTGLDRKKMHPRYRRYL